MPMEFGCTSYTWENADSTLHFMGRTFDAAPTELQVQFVPRGYRFAHLPLHENAPVTVTPYALVGIGAPFDTPLLDDAVNEHGLMATMQLYPPARYAPLDAGGDLGLNPLCFVGFALGQCTTLEEVAELAKRVTLVNDEANGLVAPVHYHFGDALGRSMVVEPTSDGSGRLGVYENAIGVMTNAPAYPWHVTNLRNYIMLQPAGLEARNVCGLELERFGSGSGLRGMPGDYSSPSRFVRMAYTKEFLEKGVSEAGCVVRMFKGFSTVTIPEGVDEANFNGGEADGKPVYDISLYTCVMCAESRTYYFCTHETLGAHAVRLDDLLGKGERASWPLPRQPRFEYLA